MAKFKAPLLRPVGEDTWAFVILPKNVSDALPRRGRTSVTGTVGGHLFSATLDPDGQFSHWLRVDESLCLAAGVEIGEIVEIELAPAEAEIEPTVPDDFKAALADWPEAQATFDATTTIARIDWVHWIESAKQQKTRAKRIHDGCDMLASGKKRVCCFDQSGFYSKSLSAPIPET